MVIIYEFLILHLFFRMMEYLKDCCKEERDVCERVFLLTLTFLCVVPPFPSTRGSSDTIAPGVSLPIGSQEMKGPLLQAEDKSGVVAKPLLIQNYQTVHTVIQDWGLVQGQRSQGVCFRVQNSKSFMQNTFNPACFHVCAQILPIHSFIHSNTHPC